MSWQICSDDEVGKIVNKNLSDVDTLIEIIKVKANLNGTLFVYVPHKYYIDFFPQIFIETVTFDHKIFFTVSANEKTFFNHMRKRIYYNSVYMEITHYYNLFLKTELINSFITNLFSSLSSHAKHLVTIHPKYLGNDINIIPELPTTFFN